MVLAFWQPNQELNQNYLGLSHQNVLFNMKVSISLADIWKVKEVKG